MVGDTNLYRLIAEKGGEKDYNQNSVRDKSRDLMSAVTQIKTQLLGNPRLKDSKNIYDELLATKNQLSNQQKSMSEELKRIPKVEQKLREIDNLLQASCNLINDVFGRLEEQNQELAKKLDDFDSRFFTKFQEFADQQQQILTTVQQPNIRAKPQPEEEKSGAKDQLSPSKSSEAFIQGAQHISSAKEEVKATQNESSQLNGDQVGNDERILLRLESLSEKVKEVRKKRGPFNYGEEPKGLGPRELKFLKLSTGIYHGEVLKGTDTRHGKGIHIHNNGHIYEGWCINDTANGQGRQISTIGNVHECEYKNNNKNGHGIYYGYNGDIYKGEWLDDKKHGQGIYTWLNGDRYEGNWSHNKRDGKGTLYQANGDSFASDTWKDDKMNGIGIFSTQVVTKEEHTYDMGTLKSSKKL